MLRPNKGKYILAIDSSSKTTRKANEGLKTRKAGLFLRSDVELISYLVTASSANAEVIKTTICKYIDRIQDGGEEGPSWVKKLIAAGGTSIKQQINSQPKAINYSLLKLASHIFGLHVLLYLPGFEEEEVVEFGKPGKRPFKVFLTPEGYSISPEFHSIIENGQTSNFNMPSTTKNEVSDGTPSTNNTKENNPVHFDTPSNSYGMNKKETSFPAHSINNEIRVANEVKYSPNAKRFKGFNRAYKRNSYLTYKDLSNSTSDNIPRIKGVDDLNYNDQDQRDILDQPSRRQAYESKDQNDYVFRRTDNVYDNFNGLLFWNSENKETHVTNRSSFEDALSFIADYQQRLEDLRKDDHDAKQYKPVVISKTGFFINGKLKFYKDNNKFGFIEAENGKQVFLHKDSLVRSRIDSRRFENCSKYFGILLRFKVLKYQGKTKMSEKAVEIEILNFLPLP